MRTIWWENGQVRMIDQRILPLEFEIATYSDYQAVAKSITDMVIRGAPAIGAAGAYGMALAAQQSTAADRDNLLADLETAKHVLDTARPTAVNLTWATRRLIELAYRLDVLDSSLSGPAAVNAIRSALLAEAERLADVPIPQPREPSRPDQREQNKQSEPEGHQQDRPGQTFGLDEVDDGSGATQCDDPHRRLPDGAEAGADQQGEPDQQAPDQGFDDPDIGSGGSPTTRPRWGRRGHTHDVTRP